MAVRHKVFKIFSGFVDDLEGVLAEIEISVRPGIPTFDVIGLCDSSIKECRGRVRAAVISAGFLMPGGHVTVNISPAYIKKSGTCCDLAVALGLLFVSEQLHAPRDSLIYAEGELSLTGDVRPTPGGSMRLRASCAKRFDYKLIPGGEEIAAGSACIDAMCVNTLFDAAAIFMEDDYRPQRFDPSMLSEVTPELPDISCVKGQEKAKRAILIAASGRHNLMLLGSPGCGKTMAAKLTSEIMPPLTDKEKCEICAINEIVSVGEEIKRPFRYIYPGITPGRILGSYKFQRPGECIMANNGILFADEICEFKPQLLDLLRIPMENGTVSIDNGEKSSVLKSSFIFIGAGNPCRCGNLFEPGKKCTCSPSVRKRYMSKLSGPFIDRIDLFTEMRAVDPKALSEVARNRADPEGAKMRELTVRASAMQKERFGEGVYNGNAPSVDSDILRAPSDVVDTAVRIATSDGYSARGFGRLLRVGRTIADIDGRADMNVADIMEAALYRRSVITG
ncbi:MAG: ATP-binding protein [Clostridiales bacterium]|nr:ATP-binding protein [Clostridiales bacterium]